MTTLGAQYYRPPNPPRKDWRRDLERMREAGLNTVKLWACWSWIESRPGEYDFADLDELTAYADELGLRIVVNTIIENAPYWLEAEAPHARYVDNEGRAVQLTAAMNTPGGGWPGLCFDNDEAWGAASAFLTALVGRYDGLGALDVWDVWNEPHLEPASYYPERIYCYCDASVARFVEWLREKYGTIDALNEAWSRRYSDWSHVKPPRVFEAVPDLLDWRAFWFDNLARWLDRRVEVVRAAASGTTVMTHVALSGFTGQLATHTLDEFTLTGGVDAFGTSSFPTWLMDDDHVEHLFNLDTARDASRGKPFWQAELQGGRGRRDGEASTGQPRAGVVTLWMWNALAAGATGVMFWQWRPELLGPESPGYGLTAPDGSLTERVAAVTAFAGVAEQALLQGRETSASRVGLVVSRLSALHAFATDRTMGLYRDAVMGAYRLLTDADVEVTVLHEDDIAATGVPAHLATLYWPMPTVASDAVAGTLTAWVSAGGRLVAEASPGEYAPSGHRRPTVPPAAFEGLFGAREVETTTSGGDSIETQWGRLASGWQKELLDVAGSTVLGTFGDGSPGITSNEYGGGTAVLIASYPSVDYSRTRDAVSRAVIVALLGDRPEPGTRWAHQRPGLLTRRATASDGSSLVFAINWTDAAARLVAPAGTVLLAASGDATRASAEFEVPAMSAALLSEGVD